MTEEPTQGGPPGAARLDLSVPAPVSAEVAAAILGARRETWLGEPLASAEAPAGMTRYALDLQTKVGEGGSPITFHKAAFVDLGAAVEAGDEVAVEISWRAATMQPLFPVFAGRLTWRDGRLRLAGVYAPPGGALGLIADKLLLSVAARGTGRWLLQRIVETMRAAPAA